MRQAVTRIARCLTLLLGLFTIAWADTAWADPVKGASCPVDGSTFTVPTDGPITLGFDCQNVNLVITASFVPGIQKLNLTAASITIGPTPPSVAQVEIINNFGASEINVRTSNTQFGSGDIIVNHGTLKAHKQLLFACVKLGCRFEADNSQLIAAADFANPDTGGGLFFSIRGPIDIQTTFVHGGDTLEMKSIDSSVTLRCAGGSGVCKFPLDSPIDPRVVAACFPNGLNNPPVFPCTITFPTADSLTAVCTTEIFVPCNGGNKEKRFTAGTFLDFTGSTITSDEHVTFTCGTADPTQGDLIAPGATFLFDSLFIKCSGMVNISNATIVLVKNLNGAGIGSQCAVGGPCIDASGAKITAGPLILSANNGQSVINACGGTFTTPGKTFPKLNNDTTPPYAPNVLDTALECGAQGATKFCNANNPLPACLTN